MRKYLIPVFLFCCGTILPAEQSAPLPKFIYDAKPVDAKAISMGEAFSAVCDNPSAVYWNPAGLWQLEQNKYITTCVNTSQKTNASTDDLFASDSLQGKKLLFLSFADGNSAFSVSPVSDYSSDFENNKIELRANKYTFTSATQQSDKLNLGININYISAQLGVTDLTTPSAGISDGNGFSADFGLLYAVSNALKLGFSAENLPGYIWWNNYKKDILKSHIRTGLSLKPADWLLFSADYEHLVSIEKEYYHGGAQETLGKHIFIREGLISEKFFENGDKRAFTFGLGYEFKKWIIDLAAKSYKLTNPEKDGAVDYYVSLSIPL